MAKFWCGIAVFSRYHVRYCGIRTPLTPPSICKKQPRQGLSLCVFYMQINWRNVLPKFIEFCMELPFCCPSQGHQYGPVWQLEANTTICHWVLLWKHEFITPIYHPNEASTSPPRDQNPPVHLKFWNWKFEQKLYYLLTTNVALLNTLGAESADRGKLV